jgi:hypothetical protein
MNRSVAVLILAAAALLEAGGDAVVRAGLKSHVYSSRLGLFGLGAILLFAYGWVVNSPAWNFGQLLGLYVVFFFITAQLISWLAFAQPPGAAVLAGGALIVGGGVVIALFGE